MQTIHSHTRILGNTVERIAWEKGGIFAIDKANKTHISPYEPSDDDDKPNTTSQNGSPCFVLDSNTPGVVRMFRSCAKIEGESMALQLVDAKGTQLRTALKGQPMGLAGQHQYGNATLATQLCQAIVADTTIAIDDPKTLHAVRDATWPGRCQILEQAQWTHLLDGAHTLDSMTATVEFFTQQVQKECAMVFNCSHERNPIELLQLLLPLPISKVYFAKSDFSRPSPIAVPKAIALLQEEGITIHEDLLVGGDKPTWQETLGSIWKHLKYDEATSADVQCNWSARQILDDLHANHQACQVLVTGSLYLVGSFLTALEWKEESSPGEEDI
jgi:folylpolyglutamate synthase